MKIIKTIIKIIIFTFILVSIIGPIIWSDNIQIYVSDRLESLWYLEDTGAIGTADDLRRIFYEKLFGIGISAIMILVIEVLFILYNISDIIKGSTSYFIGNRMTDDND